LPAFSIISPLCHECKLIFIQLDVTPIVTKDFRRNTILVWSKNKKLSMKFIALSLIQVKTIHLT
ncbi:hypothetical protein, partial [Bacteroides caecimuris]|uniref:hypothetical protein n=1 Tax=Bacteroides caecimuris TaxID=1796613 RepID=UPI00265994F5